ncbi:MAG: tetratricopeptide repeat protein [Acidimicrobiales bacterium]
MSAVGDRRLSDRRNGDWHLADERDFLVRSLADAEKEHAAGDLSDDDFALLKARDTERLSDVDAALSRAETTREAAPVTVPERADRGRKVRWRRRWWLAAGGAALVVAAAAILIVESTAPRLPGQDATGSTDLNAAQQVEQQLAQAQVLASHGEKVQALALYGDVLAADPRDPTALCEWGWLDWQAAEKAREATVAAEGASAIEEAARIDPGLFAAQYYLGSILVEEGDPGKAVTHFAKFLSDAPSAKWLHEAAPEIRTAYAAAHEPLPNGVPKG